MNQCIHDTSPNCQAQGYVREVTFSQCEDWIQVESKSWVRSTAYHVSKKSAYSMMNDPSFPNSWSNASRAPSHSLVHSLLPSLHLPFHSPRPQGLRILRNLLPLYSTALRILYAWELMRPV